MKEFFSKLTAVLLAAALTAAVFPTAAFAQEEATQPTSVTPTNDPPASSDDLEIAFTNGGNSMDTVAVSGITARAEITGSPY